MQIRLQNTLLQVVLRNSLGSRVTAVLDNQVSVRVLFDAQASQHVSLIGNWSELDPIDLPGVYGFTLPVSQITGDRGTLFVMPLVPGLFEELALDLEVLAVSNTDLQTLLKRILGLSLENYRLDQLQYDLQGHLTQGRIQIFPDAAQVLPQTNPLATYLVESVYDAQGRLSDYRVTKQ